jgi:3-phytase
MRAILMATAAWLAAGVAHAQQPAAPVVQALPAEMVPAARLVARIGEDQREISARLDDAANTLVVSAGDRSGALGLGFAGESVCLIAGARDGLPYAFVVGDGGEIEQFLIGEDAQGLGIRSVRRLHVPTTATQCVADSATGDLYVAEEAVGVWRFNADAEADPAPAIVDAPGLGRLSGEVKGVALHGPWLIAADAAVGGLTVYDRSRDHAFVGRVALQSTGDRVEETGWLVADDGRLFVQDDAADRWLQIPVEALADALGVEAGAPVARTAPTPRFAALPAMVETTPMPSFGDAADDPAIWANPADPAGSLVVGTDKRGGLAVYDMSGAQLQYLPVGRVNNVDLRSGFRLGGEDIILVAASNRTDRSIGLYRLDPSSRQLSDVADGLQPTGLDDPYGLCMYRSPRDGATYVFINDSGGDMRQWRLEEAGGRVRAALVRTFRLPTQPEGCLADDVHARLYVGEEDVGLWRFAAEPDGGDARVGVAMVADNPALKDDIEGVALYDLGDGEGYLVVSSQGNDSYAVFERTGDNRYRGSFAIVANAARGIDGASETDGLDVSSADLGPGFGAGAVVVQDGRNVLPGETQNFKYLPWSAVAGALGLRSR